MAPSVRLLISPLPSLPVMVVEKSRDDILLVAWSGLVWSGWWVDLTEHIPSCGKEEEAPSFLTCLSVLS